MSGVRSTNPDYDRLLPKWNRCADTVDGQDAMRAARERYLPKLVAEDDTQYKARLARSDYYNATWRTIAGLSGMAFAKPPIAVLPAAIESYREDIDLAGCELDQFAQNCVEDALQFGLYGLLVDHPPMAENVQAITKVAAERMGLRPAIKRYPIRSIINWRYGHIENRWVLVQVVLKEKASVAEDEFEHKCEDRYRVLDMDEAGHYRQRVFRIDNHGRDELVEGPIYPMIANKPFAEIPFRIVGDIDEPPLIDLVDANIAHYQVNSDYRHGLHFTGLPTLFLAGVVTEDSAPFYIGGQAAITSPDPNADGKFIEFTGQGLDAMAAALKALEQRMALLGARMLADETKQAETLGATKIKRAGENGVLAAIVQEVSRSLEWALGIFAEWSGAGGDVEYAINRDYNPQMLGPQELTALFGLVQGGELSRSEFFELLQRGDIIDGAKTFEDHQAEVEIQAPAPARPVVDDDEDEEQAA